MGPREITPELAYLRLLMVNVLFVGHAGAGDREWVLIDAGLPGNARRIARAAARRFGEGSRPAAILLTHGHFDHVGSLRPLIERWDVPVYAHRLELPYLTGRSPYPPPDPTVGGGAMSLLSVLYPRGPFDFGASVRPLPEDGSVPGLPAWRWVHTPGHAAGHVSFHHPTMRTLVSGDAVITTDQESLLAVLSQRFDLRGPPWYWTPDWSAAQRSVERLATLEPQVLAPGHGRPLVGRVVPDMLYSLARHFAQVSVPKHGRYVDQPAVPDGRGILAVPRRRWQPRAAAGLGAALLAGTALYAAQHRRWGGGRYSGGRYSGGRYSGGR
jgi:glyoxylase-like metal-dependent hydrolase (beta-lactamase superfamily II)